MFKAITPKFINKLDAHLLVHYPLLWMSKLHYVLWHGLLLWLFSALLGFILPINLKNNIEYGLWYFLFTVLGIVILCFWIYRYAIFNKEKNYGSRTFVDEFKNFILVFASVAVFLLIPWPFEMVYTQRVADSYSDEEMLQDINTLNELDPYLVNSTSDYYTWYDTLTQVQYFNVRQLSPHYTAPYTPYFLISDSVEHKQILTSYQLFKRYKPKNDYAYVKAKVEQFINIASKYDCKVMPTADELTKRFLELHAKYKNASNEFNPYDYSHYELLQIFANVSEAKFLPLFIFKSDYLWTMFYVVLSITALLLLFKMNYWQQFLVNIVIMLLYPLVMFIFSQLMPYGGFMRGSGFFLSSLVALFLFSGITLFVSAMNSKRYQPYINIWNQLFYLTLVYAPMLIIALLDVFGVFHTNYYSEYALDETMYRESRVAIEISVEQNQLQSLYYYYWIEEYKRWFNIARYGGIALFVVGLPFFKELFVKQISLPKKS